MADYKVTDTELTSIANAIRTKVGTESLLEFPTGFVSAIGDIMSGDSYVLSGVHGNIITGTANPSAPQGVHGDIYLKLLDHNTEYSTVAETYMNQNGTWVTLGTIHLPYTELEIVPFRTGTDEQIANMIAAAHYGGFNLHNDGGWNIGDVRSISVSAFTTGVFEESPAQTIDICISSFDQYMNCGNVMQFDFRDCLSNGFWINKNNVLADWESTWMYNYTMPALADALPSWLRENLITFNVLSAPISGGELVTVPNNKLALRSSYELLGSSGYGPQLEGPYIPWYVTRSLREKKRGHSGTARTWWTRSTRNTSYYITIDSSGDMQSYKSYDDRDKYGVAPFGCL